MASMGWHCIIIWECQLKSKQREQTLKSLEFTLSRIFIQDHKKKQYQPTGDNCMRAAEPTSNTY